MYDTQDWERARQLVIPELRGRPELFYERVRHGMEHARPELGLVVSTTRARPTSAVFAARSAHLFIFDGAYRCAGALRDQPSVNGLIWPAWPTRIQAEILQLARASFADLTEARKPAEKARAIALLIGRMWIIQPFLDGNTRTLSLLGNALSREYLGRESPSLGGDVRKLAFCTFAYDNDLRALAQVVCDLDISARLGRVADNWSLWPARIEVRRKDGSFGHETAITPRDALKLTERHGLERAQAHEVQAIRSSITRIERDRR